MPVLNVEQDFDFDTGQWRDAPAATATAADVHAQEPAHVQGAPPLSTPQRLVLEELLTELETRTMERPHGGLRLFIERAWPILDPATPFVGGWYIDAIAEHLTAVSRGELRDLIILMPPRFGKSKIVAVYWPCWEWGPANLPHYRWLFNTYTLSLTLRDSAYRRQVMESAWYRRRWGSRFTLGKERFRPDTASKYENNHSGFHFATSVGGSNTGEGGHRVVVDDSLGAQDAYSESARETVIRWWTVVMPSRRNDDSSARIIVQQRLHERDLAGFLMKEEGGYTVLSLPNEYDPARPCVTRWFRDPRTEAGELLCPGRVSRAQTEELKSPTLGLGEADYAHQYQQLAVPEGGGIWKQAWWRYWVPRFHPLANTLDEHGHLIVALPPQFDRRIHTWDMTFKKTAGGSFVSGMAWGKRQAAAYLLGVYRERVGFVDTLQAVRNLLRAHPAHAVYVEGKANGPAVIDVLRLEIPGLIESKTERGKEEYAHAASPHVEAGNYVLPHPSLYPWVAPCLQRICAFPNAQFDDEVDTITQADRQLFIQQPFDARRFAQGSDHGI